MLNHCNLGTITSTASVWYKNTEQSMLVFDLDILGMQCTTVYVDHKESSGGQSSREATSQRLWEEQNTE